ncbi:CPBP family intramembrane glutamic endopeptidase [Haladaptatus pallidirubidus]|uniref:CPBP family intramembrane glutamic endopeptidase n=1 Tax=Haladaptatus pallidirubidus TaxID=1008152 RepID=UPI001D1139E8|nr:type II CAAX endopeptidase family protein [Haladaptatus pallidirubidus]
MGLAWRIAFVFLVVILIWLLILHVNRVVFGPGYDRLGHVVSALLLTTLTVPAVVLARRFLDKRPLRGLGIPPLRTGLRSFCIGIGCYLIPAGIGLGVALALGWVDISLTTSLTTLAGILLGLIALVFLSEALLEELIFRGYIYRNLNGSLPCWTSVGGQALLFSLWGISIGAFLTTERIVFFFFVAVVIGMIRAITNDTWACIGFHLAFQTVQQLFTGPWASDAFIVSASGTLERVVFGLVPIALAVLVLELIVGKDTDWSARHPDTVPIERDRSGEQRY